MKVLVTGGAGYIGSTVGSALADRGITPVVLDSLVTGRESFAAGRTLYRGDIADGRLVDRIFAEHPDIGAVIHCAALIVVPESVASPLRYYRENVSKTIGFLEHLLRNRCSRILFSSSASIYRPGDDFTVDEESPIEPTSPYARTKAMIENVLRDVSAASDLRALSLRYFNPIGADPHMRTGLQTPEPTHALGRMMLAWERGTTFPITGVDWPTRDGTGIRDYIHVWDLAQAHVEAVVRFDRMLAPDGAPQHQAINLGGCTGTTVRELVAAFDRVVGGRLPTVETDRRPGDTAGAYTRSSRAASLLGWRARLSLEDGIRHSLQWRALDTGSRTPVGVH